MEFFPKTCTKFFTKSENYRGQSMIQHETYISTVNITLFVWIEYQQNIADKCMIFTPFQSFAKFI